MKCSFYRNSNDSSSTNYVEVSSILDAIKNGRWKKEIEDIRAVKSKARRSEMKKALPGFTVSGTFEQKPVYNSKTDKYDLKSRRDGHILDYTGLMIIDIDDIPIKDLVRIKKWCSEDMFLHCCFISPSGGLKMIYEVEATAEYHKTASFAQVKEYVEGFYETKVDKSGKNISRLCYVSYDPEMYLNENHVCIPIDVEEYERQQKEYESRIAEIDYDNISNDLNHIWEVAKGWLENKGNYYVSGNRNNYIHAMSCILNRAGLTEDQIIGLIASNHSINKEMKGELLDAVRGVSRRNRNEFGTKPIYDKRSKPLKIKFK